MTAALQQQYQHLLSKINQLESTLDNHTKPFVRELTAQVKQLNAHHEDLLAQCSSFEAKKEINKRTKRSLDTSIHALEEEIDQYSTQTTSLYKKLAELKQQHVDKSIQTHLPSVLALEQKLSSESLQERIRLLQQAISQSGNDSKYVSSPEGKQEVISIIHDLSENHHHLEMSQHALTQLKELVKRRENHDKNQLLPKRFTGWNLYELGFAPKDYNFILGSLSRQIDKFPEVWAKLEEISSISAFVQDPEGFYETALGTDRTPTADQKIKPTMKLEMNTEHDFDFSTSQPYPHQTDLVSCQWSPVSGSILSQIDETSHEQTQLDQDTSSQADLSHNLSAASAESSESSDLVITDKNRSMIELLSIIHALSPLNTIATLLRPWAYLHPSILSPQPSSSSSSTTTTTTTTKSTSTSSNQPNQPNQPRDTDEEQTSTTQQQNKDLFDTLSRFFSTSDDRFAPLPATSTGCDSSPRSNTGCSKPHNDRHGRFHVDHTTYDKYRTLFHIQEQCGLPIDLPLNDKTSHSTKPTAVTSPSTSTSSRSQLQSQPSCMLHSLNQHPLEVTIAYMYQLYSSQHNINVLKRAMEDFLHLLPLMQHYGIIPQFLYLSAQINTAHTHGHKVSDQEHQQQQDKLHNIYEQFFMHVLSKINHFVHSFRNHIQQSDTHGQSHVDLDSNTFTQ